MKEVHIFFGTDEQYFKYTSIIIYSIAVSAQTNKEIHKDKKIIFHVIAEPLSESLLKKIKEFSYLVNKTFPSEIVYHSADSEKFNKYPGWSETKNHSTYLRFLIPDFVNENVHKVLYLDSDMICNSDILDLFEVDLQGKTIGAIPDIIDEANLKGYLVRKNKKTFGKNFKYTYKDDAYFNAGVLLIDLDKWKEKKISEKACDVLDQFYTPLCDQDALNMVLFGDVCFLPAKWNFLWSSCFNKNSNILEKSLKKLPSKITSLFIPYIKDYTKVALIHFVTSFKPWKKGLFIVTDGSIDELASKIKIDYLTFAATMPLFSDEFIEAYRMYKDIDKIEKALIDYNDSFKEWINTDFVNPLNKLKIKQKKYSKLLKIIFVVQIIQFIVLVFILIN